MHSVADGSEQLAKRKKPKSTSARAAAATKSRPLASLALAWVGGLFMYVIVSNGFFLTGRPLLLGLLPGLVVGLMVDEPILSPVTTAVALAAGVLLSPPAAIHATDGRVWLLGTGLMSMVVAALVAWGATSLRKTEGRSQLLAIAGVAFIVATMWYGATTVAGSDELSGDAALVTALDAPVQPYRDMTDPEVYLFVRQRMSAGVSYYAAWNEIISALGDRYEQSAPVKYRLPTLQWFWNLLPASAWSIVVAMLAFGTLAVVSAYWFASRLTAPPLGLVSAAAVATLYLRVASGPYLLQYEGWAAALTLAALALGMESLRASAGRATTLMWLSAIAALIAALTRELSIYFLIGALGVAVLSPEGRQRRICMPWAAVTVVLVAAYVAHLAQLGSSGDLASGGFSLPQDYSSPPKGHFAATLAYGTWLLGGLPWLPWLAYGLALGGSLALKGWLKWTSFWAVAVPTSAFVFFSPITVSGNPAGYWGMLVTPLAFAIAPTAALWLPRGLRNGLEGAGRTSGAEFAGSP